jgi:HEPN domain-containing protein
MSVPTPADVTRRWLRFAHEDLKLAEAAATTGDYAPHIACFHAQQCAEKALKAILVFLQIGFPYRHDLDEIVRLIPPSWHVSSAYPDLSWLTQWATVGPYPGNWPEATDQNALDAAQQARDVWETVLDDLNRHGLDVSAYR